MKDFILAALPLVALGVAIAVAVTCGLRAKRAATAAMNSPEDEKPVKKQSDGTHMCLGMCLGLVVGLFCSNFAKSWNQGVCMTLGMCFGMMIGSIIDASRPRRWPTPPTSPKSPRSRMPPPNLPRKPRRPPRSPRTRLKTDPGIPDFHPGASVPPAPPPGGEIGERTC